MLCNERRDEWQKQLGSTCHPYSDRGHSGKDIQRLLSHNTLSNRLIEHLPTPTLTTFAQHGQGGVLHDFFETVLVIDVADDNVAAESAGLEDIVIFESGINPLETQPRPCLTHAIVLGADVAGVVRFLDEYAPMDSLSADGVEPKNRDFVGHVLRSELTIGRRCSCR